MRKSAVMLMSAFVGLGAGAVGASFIQPAYSDGMVSQNVSPYGVTQDAPKNNNLVHQSPLQRPLNETTVAQANQAPVQHEMGQRPYTPTAQESIEVQARRLPNGTPVSVRGTITRISGKNMVIERHDGVVHARLPGEIDEIRDGNNVTVFGRIANRGDVVAVDADAVFMMTSLRDGKIFLPPSKLQSVQARNIPVTRGAARNALDYYHYNFTPL